MQKNIFSIDLSMLNSEQREAVTCGDGPLLIIAGAGTGKTSVITNRIAYLISEKKAKPEEILALTFTDKAAAEMEERVDKLVPYGFIDTWILTFHAFGDRIIRENALDLGLPSNYKILSKPEQIVFVEDNLGAFDLKYYAPLSNPTKHIEALTSHFSRLKDEMVEPERYISLCQQKLTDEKDEEEKKEWEKQLELALAYLRYQELMGQNGFLDFGDQINICLKLLKNNKHILKKYQTQFKYILVDEFQDTNMAQNELVKILAGENGNITVVGDDNQSIYKFRGAAISNILDFKQSYLGTKEIVLTKNYRSTQEILDASYRLIKHNDPNSLEFKLKISKKLVTEIHGSKPVHIHCDKLTSEADKVASIIKEKITSGKYSFKDFAILVRKNSAAQSFMRSLAYYGIPYKFDGSAGLYNRPEIRLLINFTKVITDPKDSISFFHLASSEIYNFSVSDLSYLNTFAGGKKRTLEWAMKNEEKIEEIKDNLFDTPQEKIKEILADLKKYREMSRQDTVGQLLYSFLKDSGYLSSLIREADNALKTDEKDGSLIKIAEAQVKISNIAKFFDRISQFEHVSQDKSILNFKMHLESLMEAGEDPSTAAIDPDLEAVSILTAHKAKGLEFEVVFIANSVAGYFPSTRRSDPLTIPSELVSETLPEGDEKETHLEEERRLFYVAMTRAKKELYLTSAEDYGGQRVRKISPFVLEALDLPAVNMEKVKLSGIEVIKKFEKGSGEVALPKKFYVQGKLTLSPHQVDDYLSCPKKFEFIHVLRVPVKTFHAVVYGSAVHKAVEDYFSRKKCGFPVKVEDLHNVFKANWLDEGFITREHEEKRFLAGKKALENFYQREEKLQRFPSRIEEWFLVDLLDLDVKIRGRYDAIYEDPNFIEIKDFKTSNVENKEKADDKAKKNRQLSIYALSYLHTKNKLPDKLTLDFIDVGLIGESERNEKDINKVVSEIKTVADGIKGCDYKASPGFGECGWCAFTEICPYTINDV